MSNETQEEIRGDDRESVNEEADLPKTQATENQFNESLEEWGQKAKEFLQQSNVVGQEAIKALTGISVFCKMIQDKADGTEQRRKERTEVVIQGKTGVYIL